MHRFRILLITVLVPLPASLWGENEYYTIRICNRGQLAIDVATGYQDSALFNSYWTIDRWYHVNPGNCSVSADGAAVVYDRFSDFGGGLGRSSLPEDHVHLAFAFTDSTGVWGAGMMNPYETNARIGNMKIEKEDLKPSNRRFCIHPGNGAYTKDGPDPAARCDGGGRLLVPASIDYAAHPNSPLPFGKGIPTTFNVGFGAGDRAIPKGSGPPQTSSNAGTSTGNSDDTSFWALLLREVAKDGAEAAKKPLPPVEAARQQAQGRAGMLGWVREDVAAYIAASKSGFAAYKKGEAQAQAGLRMWESNTKPMFAQGCWVVQADTQTTFSCLLYDKKDLNEVNAAYAELTGDISQSLPRDWMPLAGPAFGPEFPSSKGYRSSSGLYELHFQIVTAAPGTAVTPPPVTSTGQDDDPIGGGGFITPPKR